MAVKCREAGLPAVHRRHDNSVWSRGTEGSRHGDSGLRSAVLLGELSRQGRHRGQRGLRLAARTRLSAIRDGPAPSDTDTPRTSVIRAPGRAASGAPVCEANWRTE